MKKFEILRYLKRFSLLIFLVSLAGAAAIYLYADGRQKYTASVIIRYTNDGISDGYTPDGSELDVNEIYSSTVISQAMDALGASGRLSTIRSNISVTPVISEDQETINDALLQKGEEVTYFPDTYKVSLVVDGEQGAGYARNMLDAIIQSYCTYYTEKYVEQKLSLNPSSGLLGNGYDYYECIRILENDTNEMQDYLLSKREHYPNFRSSRTGYTYADLCDIYSDFKKYTIPALYAYVLNGPQVRDGTVLQEYLANTIETAKQNEQITTEQRDSLWSLTDQYVYKNADLLQNYFTDRGEVVSSDYILNNIELEGAGDKAQTTYDGLVLKLVSLEQQVASSQIDRQFQEEILQSFRNVDFGGTGEQHAKMESMINDYEAQLKSYYEIINTSSKELNLYISADYLKMISSVQVAAAINVKLYLMLALVLFFVIGCCGAILLGRISDAVDYLLYVDKKTGLPNREKLNVYITGMADRILHAHNEAMGLYALKGAEKAGLQVRIAHAHNIWIVRDYKWPLKMFCKQLLPGAATHLWACGRDAGIYYFGKADWERRGQIIPNAIEPETFRFSPAVRAEMRARYGLEDRVVLGHVGRFDVRKNHERLLEIFAAFLQLEPRAMLVLIGTGRLEQAVRAQAQELGITDHILFAGLQSNVADWYQMMDLFVMPSRFEGLPVVGIEAQAAGLGCVFSDAVPAEVLLSSHAIQIPLSASNADWAAGLQRMLHQPCDRSAGAELIRQAGYDINIAAARLQQQYLQLGGQA